MRDRGHTASRPQRSRAAARARSVAVLAAAISAVVVLVGAPGPVAGAVGEDGQAVFDQLCKGCHTIGGGKLAGPDLAGLPDRRDRDWVERFILAPDEVIASGDPIAAQLLDEYGTQMPNLGVTEAQLAALIAFLGYTAPGPAPTPSPAPEPAPTTGDAESGKRLFKGVDRFGAGGPSCLSCHSIAGVGALGGGQLGPDLTGAFEKYGGAQGVQAALESLPFPTMAPIFSRRQLTADERADIAAFLAAAPQDERPGRAAGKLLGLSAAAAGVLVFAALGIWRRRLTGVRRTLVDSSGRE